MNRRIAAPKGLEGFLEALTSKGAGEPFPLFQTKQKALTFAAAFGLSLGKKTQIDQREAGTAIRHDIFQGEMDDAFLAALAVTETASLNVLADEREEEFGTIFEEYAHTGLLELQRRFETGGDRLDTLVALMNTARSPSPPPELAGMDAEILQELMR